MKLRTFLGITLTVPLITVLVFSFGNVSVEATSEIMRIPEDYSGRARTQGNPNSANPLDPFFSENNSPNPKFVPREIIVKFKSNSSVEEVNGSMTTGFGSLDELNERYGVTEMQKVFDKVYKVLLPDDIDVLSTAMEYGADLNVEYAEPNYFYHTCIVPNDANYASQWAHQVIKSEFAWDIETGDPDVVIAVIDTGVDWNHPDLAANIWNNTDEIVDDTDTDGNGYVDDIRGYDFVDITWLYAPGEDGPVKDNNPMDFHGHGTHCAGIAAAVTNNGIGIAGVCWNCKIMPLRAGYKDWFGKGILLSDAAAEAIVYAVDNDVDIISMSFGGYSPSELIYDAVKYAYDSGVLLVAAAGNDATSDKSYPAAYDEVNAVTATQENDNPWREWWYGTNYGDWVEVAAPGVDIYSTMFDDVYTDMTGTSMATPHVAGVAALIWSRFPSMTRNHVRQQLRQTSNDLGSPGFDIYYGYGRINAEKAVETAQPDHDILIFDWETPPYLKPEDTTTINTTLLNFGMADENNIQVQLLVNGSVANSTLINFMGAGALVTVSWNWTPSQGTYNVTSYVVPVPSEMVTENNAVSTSIVVRSGKILRVPEDYSTIQAAINAAISGWGDTIHVSSGTYHENVIVNKTVSLVGENMSTTIIEPEETWKNAVHITSDNVSFSGFWVRNGGSTGMQVNARDSVIAGNIVTSCSGGIDLHLPVSAGGWYYSEVMHNNTVVGNTVANISYVGISLSMSNGNNLSNNTVTDNGYGILFEDYSARNTLRHNKMSGNGFNFGLRASFLHGFIHDIDTSNTVDGRPIYYLVNQHDKEIPADAGFVTAYNSTNITVRNLNLTKNYFGALFVLTTNSTLENVSVSDNYYSIAFLLSEDNTVINNTITDNQMAALNLESGSSSNTVRENTMQSNGVGIYMSSSSENNDIIENTISTNDYSGIYIGYCSNNNIHGNHITNNRDGISITYSSENNNVSDNTITANTQYGLYLSSGYNTLRNNNMTGNRYNFGVYASHWLPNLIQDIDTSNTVDGKPILYLVNQKNLVINSLTFPNIGYLAIVNSTEINVADLTFTNNVQGILLAFTSNSTIKNVNTSNNEIGIDMTYSQGNKISRCTIANNSDGIKLYYYSSNNTIHHNNFIGNYRHASNFYPSVNIWDDGYPCGGNYWSDYTGVDLDYDGIGDTPYVIDEDNQDNYPLMGMFSDFSITYQEEIHDVTTICNSTISGFHFDHANRIIGFDVTGSDGTIGFCRIMIPTILIEGPYTILVDGEEISYTLLPISNSTHTFLYFTYVHSIHHIIITGPPTPPVGGKATPIDKLIIKPESQIPWIWLLTIILSLAVTVVYVKKRKRHTEIYSWANDACMHQLLLFLVHICFGRLGSDCR